MAISVDDELRSIQGITGAIRVLPEVDGAIDDQDLVGVLMYSGLEFQTADHAISLFARDRLTTNVSSVLTA